MMANIIFQAIPVAATDGTFPGPFEKGKDGEDLKPVANWKVPELETTIAYAGKNVKKFAQNLNVSYFGFLSAAMCYLPAIARC